MSFGPILQRIVDECGGGLAAMLIERDGIPIDQVEVSQLTSEERERVGNAAVELVRILEEVRKASDTFAGGPVAETIVGLERYWIVLRPVDAETLLVVTLAPEGNLGKARFLMRRHLAGLREQL